MTEAEYSKTSSKPDDIIQTVCPHDCPSACGLEVKLNDKKEVVSVKGARAHTYTDGVICAKVSRYNERLYHPERLTMPLRRVGDKGENKFVEISWDEALDEIVSRFSSIEAEYGAKSIWLYYFAGTMGLLMRDGINRLSRAKGYSGMHGTICVTPAWTGFKAGTGLIAGVDPREMAESDCIVLWGTNPVSTQVNVMRHAIKARKARGAKIIHVDVYHNATSRQADMALIIRPGTDAALACAVMHILFRDGLADLNYLAEYADQPEEFAAHLQSKTPQWASAITGLEVSEIEAFAKLVGSTPRTYFRLGYGFTRQRNGTVNMHAALCIATVTGAWQYKGGGAFHNNTNIYGWDKTRIEGLDMPFPPRMLDQSRIGEILTGDTDALQHGGSVHAMLIQNTNPAVVAPDTNRVLTGLRRNDLFLVVHEQFMTETATYADIVLPATMFLEHNDLYQGGGHQYAMLGAKVVEAPGECWSNHEVISTLGRRLGLGYDGFEKDDVSMLDETLIASGRPDIEGMKKNPWHDCQPDFNKSHYLEGFAFDDGKFRFFVDWEEFLPKGYVDQTILQSMPNMPDHWDVLETETLQMPFRLVTAPARQFLNTSFTETKTSRQLEGRPQVMIHPADAEKMGINDGMLCKIGNDRGTVVIHALHFEGLQPGVLIVESLWPNHSFVGGVGINSLTGADPVSPIGGAAFHDNAVWIKAYDQE